MSLDPSNSSNLEQLALKGFRLSEMSALPGECGILLLMEFSEHMSEWLRFSACI